MSTSVIFNGTTYSIPVEGDSDWGTNLSNYFVAIAAGAFQKTGGSFTLTAETNFGATYGLKTAYVKSQATNPASNGVFRLGNAESIKWRNAANTGDLDLTVNASNALQFNSNSIALQSSALSQFAATTSAQLASVISDETGSGALVFATSPTLVTPALGTPSSGNLSNCTSIPMAQASGALAIANGGTGQTAALAAFDALSPTTTKGDLIAFNTTTSERLPVGTDGQILTADAASSGGIKWANASSAASGVSGAVQFSNGSVLTSDATNFFWDDTNNRLGIGTNTPSARIHSKQTSAVAPGGIGLYLEDSTGSSSNQFGLKIDSAAAGNAGSVRFNYHLDAGGATAGISLLTGGATPTEKVRITSSGAVGIGTTLPAFAASRTGMVLRGNANGVELLLQETVNDTDGSTNGVLLAKVGSDGYFINRNNGSLFFYTNSVERMSLSNTGLLTLAAGQIKFPASQNASADANTLDDYEEGTWTPSLGGTSVLSIVAARYTKIGRVVNFTVYFVITSLGTGSTSVISGLPFTSGSDVLVSASYWTGVSAAYTVLSGYLQSGTSTIQMYGATAATANIVTQTPFATGAAIALSGHYTV